MLARLLWQTWRDSWKLLFVPLGVGLFLMLGLSALAGLIQLSKETVKFITFSMLQCIPALYGAMVFYSDQRRGNFRFLAEHAARPRYVWLFGWARY